MTPASIAQMICTVSSDLFVTVLGFEPGPINIRSRRILAINLATQGFKSLDLYNFLFKSVFSTCALEQLSNDLILSWIYGLHRGNDTRHSKFSVIFNHLVVLVLVRQNRARKFMNCGIWVKSSKLCKNNNYGMLKKIRYSAKLNFSSEV